MSGAPPAARGDVVTLVLDRCESTQDEALALLATTPTARVAVVRASSQARGRGRQGRSWLDVPGGTSLALSVAIRGPLPVTMLEGLMQRVAGRVVTLLAAECGVTAEVKAPNDVVVDGRKLAGILADARTTGEHVDHLVVGVGINLRGDDFTVDGRPATTLEACVRRTLATRQPGGIIGAR